MYAENPAQAEGFGGLALPPAAAIVRRRVAERFRLLVRPRGRIQSQRGSRVEMAVRIDGKTRLAGHIVLQGFGTAEIRYAVQGSAADAHGVPQGNVRGRTLDQRTAGIPENATDGPVAGQPAKSLAAGVVAEDLCLRSSVA